MVDVGTRNQYCCRLMRSVSVRSHPILDFSDVLSTDLLMSIQSKTAVPCVCHRLTCTIRSVMNCSHGSGRG